MTDKDCAKLKDCLAASLTILCHQAILSEDQLTQTIKREGYDGLYDLLNKKYQELTEND